MFKKIGILTSASLIAFSALTADQMDNRKSDSMMDMFDGGFTLGSTTAVSVDGTRNYAMFGYIDDMFLFDIGASYVHVKDSTLGFKGNFTNLLADLGLRNRLSGNLFVTYGVEGSVVCGKVPNGRPYTVGIFTGLDYQISRHFLLSGKILPFNYGHPMNHVKEYKVFESGTIELAYVF